MRNPLAAILSLRIFLFLSAVLFSANVLAVPAAAAAAAPAEGKIKIVSRQSPGTVLNTDQACQQYGRVANLSAVGSNSTLRITFLDASPLGTLANQAMLNLAINQLPMLTSDAQLNQACGNLTTVALTEAANNFTKGIILQFTFTPSTATLTNGPVMILVTLLCLAFFVIPFSAV